MKNILPVALLGLLGLIVGCSPATKILASWNRTDTEPKKYKKLGVVVLSPKISNRAIVESALAMKFRSKGVKAIATFDIFPLAGKIDKVREKMDEETIQEKVRQQVARHELDALFILALMDKQQETHYVEGSSFSIGGPMYGYPNYPVYGYPYYGYYSYAYTSIYSPGYYETTTTLFVESNLYDVASENLMWSAQTETKNPTDIEKEAENFADLIVNQILTDEALKP